MLKDFVHVAAYDGGVMTNLRRFVYFIMIIMMFIKVPTTIAALMFANELKDPATVASRPGMHPTPDNQMDPSILIRKDAPKPSNPFAQFP